MGADLDLALYGVCTSQLMARSLTFLELAQMVCFCAQGAALQQFNRVLFPARHAPDVLEMLVFGAQIGARDPRDSFKNLTSRAGGCAKW